MMGGSPGVVLLRGALFAGADSYRENGVLAKLTTNDFDLCNVRSLARVGTDYVGTCLVPKANHERH